MACLEETTAHLDLVLADFQVGIMVPRLDSVPVDFLEAIMGHPALVPEANLLMATVTHK